MLGLVIYGFSHRLDAPPEPRSFYDRLAHAGQNGKGANLDAPADPSRAYPARPEWYFLSLFQLLKYFEGEQEIIGTVIIPNGLLLLLAILPLLGYGRMRSFGHIVGVVVVGLKRLRIKLKDFVNNVRQECEIREEYDEHRAVSLLLHQRKLHTGRERERTLRTADKLCEIERALF